MSRTAAIAGLLLASVVGAAAAYWFLDRDRRTEPLPRPSVETESPLSPPRDDARHRDDDAPDRADDVVADDAEESPPPAIRESLPRTEPEQRTTVPSQPRPAPPRHETTNPRVPVEPTASGPRAASEQRAAGGNTAPGVLVGGQLEPDRAEAGNDAAESRSPARRSDAAPTAPEPRAPGLAVVRLLPSSAVVGVGESLAVSVELTGGVDVGHVPFHLRFDPGVLRFEAGEEGGFLGSDGTPTYFVAAPTTSGEAVVVALSRLGHVTGVNGGGLLCTLRFTAVGPGDAGLAFARASVRNGENNIAPASFLTASVGVR